MQAMTQHHHYTFNITIQESNNWMSADEFSKRTGIKKPRPNILELERHNDFFDEPVVIRSTSTLRGVQVYYPAYLHFLKFKNSFRAGIYKDIPKLDVKKKMIDEAVQLVLNKVDELKEE